MVAAALPLALAACGSTGSAGSSSATTSGATTGACREVAAILTDGPDPGADPVGYAEAQVIPLKGVHTSDSQLRRSITALSAAYERFYDSDGSATARQALNQAVRRIDATCPGAAQAIKG